MWSSQGSILSPLLFLIYVNDMCPSLKHGTLVQYADDTTPCFKQKSTLKLEKFTIIELNRCIQNFHELNLYTNAMKSAFFTFVYVNVTPKEIWGNVNETEINQLDSTKFLRIYLDQGLTWNIHKENICKQLATGSLTLRNLSTFFPDKDRVHKRLQTVYNENLGNCMYCMFERAPFAVEIN